jgi:hypothetical protein
VKDVAHARARARPVGVLALLALCAPLYACVYDWDLGDTSEGSPSAGEHAARGDAALESDAETVQSPSMHEELDAGWADAATAPRGDGGTHAGASGATPKVDATVAMDGASSDAQLPDNADATVVSNDARPPSGADAAPAAFACEKLDAAFCADFEQGTLDVFSWQEVTFGTRASVGLVDGGTAPGGLALRSALGGTADESARAVVQLLQGAPSWFRASFDYLPSLSLPADGDQPVFWFRLTERSGDAYRGVFLGTWRAGTQLIVQNFDGVTETWDPYPTAPLPAGWVHVELELHFGRQGSATVRFNGAVAHAHLGPIYVIDVEQSFVQLGLYAEPPTLSSALYDNVVLEFAP